MATTQAESEEVVEENITTPTVAQSESVSQTDEPVRTVEVTATDSAAVTINEPSEEAGDKDDCQMDIEIQGSTTTVTVAWAEKNKEGADAEKKTSAGDQATAEDRNGNKPESDSTQKAPKVKGKRKAQPTAESSPTKKLKLINEGFCILVSNLDSSKPLDELKDALANYFMSQSVLVQDIRIDRTKIFAYVDLASQLDLTKALTLKKQLLLNKPMKIRKARVLEVREQKEKKKKVKAPRSALERKKARNARTLYVSNLPHNMTKERVLKLFPKAVAARFLGGPDAPNKGIAFVEYPEKSMAERAREKKNGFKAKGHVLNVAIVKPKDQTKAKAPPPPSKTLFVSNLHFKAHEKTIKKVFNEAVTIGLPHKGGKLKGYAFVEFASVEKAEKALKSAQNATILKRPIQVQFGEMKPPQEKPPIVFSSTTLMIRGLTEKTTPDTLKRAFEGTVSARVIADKVTKVSKGYGFVVFDSEETCKAAKESIVDCEIDGSKVTADYAKVVPERVTQIKGSVTAQPAGETVVAEEDKKKKKKRKKKKGKQAGAGKPQEEVKKAERKSVEIQS